MTATGAIGNRSGSVPLLVAAIFVALAGIHGARADDSTIDCKALDIDFVADNVAKQCSKADISSGVWVGWRQSLLAKGRGYVLLFVRTRAAHDSYMAKEDVTDIAKALGQEMIGPRPAVYPHDPVAGFDVASFTGATANTNASKIGCFAFAHYQGTVFARGGFTGPPGYAAAYIGAYCSRAARPYSDAFMADILSRLRLPRD